MAEYLGLAQSAVSRLENGQRERGYVARLLDRLEQESGREIPAATPGESLDAPERHAASLTPSGVVSPPDAAARPTVAADLDAGASTHQEAAE